MKHSLWEKSNGRAGFGRKRGECGGAEGTNERGLDSSPSDQADEARAANYPQRLLADHPER